MKDKPMHTIRMLSTNTQACINTHTYTHKHKTHRQQSFNIPSRCIAHILKRFIFDLLEGFDPTVLFGVESHFYISCNIQID